MQTESFDVGRDLAAEAQAAAAVLGRLAERSRSVWPDSEAGFTPARTTAMNGLAVAIPLALSLWVLIGVTVWLLVR